MIRSHAWCLIIVVFSALSNNHLYPDATADSIVIKHGTHLTFRRYYFISRLDKTMRLLLEIQSTHRMSFTRNLRTINFDMSLFHDKRIIRSLKRIEELRSLKPLFMIWDDFVAYKSLEDDVFIEDFSKEIFVVTRTVLSSLHDHEENDNTLWIQQLTHTPPNKTEFLLDAIDEITHALQGIVPGAKPELRQALHAPPLDLKPEVSTDEIALRFYYVQRLQKAIDIIANIKIEDPYLNLNYLPSFRSEQLNGVLRSMQQSGKPAAVLHAWDEMREYKFIDNLKFIKEFASVIFIALRHLYTGPDQSAMLNNTQTNLESLDIETILHAIDIITDQLSANTQIYNGYTPQSFQDWIAHYWWVPPVTICTIAFRLAYYIYTHHKPFGPYGYGPPISNLYGKPKPLMSHGKLDSLNFP